MGKSVGLFLFSSRESVKPIVSQETNPHQFHLGNFFTAIRVLFRNWVKSALKLRCMVIK